MCRAVKKPDTYSTMHKYPDSYSSCWTAGRYSGRVNKNQSGPSVLESHFEE